MDGKSTGTVSGPIGTSGDGGKSNRGGGSEGE